jgi:hypothetical protein
MICCVYGRIFRDGKTFDDTKLIINAIPVTGREGLLSTPHTGRALLSSNFISMLLVVISVEG